MTDPKAPLWVPALDGVRGLVCVAIAFTHVQLVANWVPRHRFPLEIRDSMVVAIEFFFVLAGWVAILPVARRGSFEGLRSYGLRRVGRIIPAYYLSLLVILLIGGWLRSSWYDTWPHGPTAFLVHLAFLQEIVYPGRVGLGVNLVVWSMTIAACFYAVFPFVVRRYVRHPFIGLAAGIAVSVAWRLATDANDKVFEQFPLFVADFAIGMTAAVLYVRVWRRGGPSPRRALAVVAAALPVFAVLLWLVGYGVVAEHQLLRHEHIVVAIAVPAVFALLISTVPFLPAWAQRPLDNSFARWVGSISYGLFTFHFVAIFVMVKVLGIQTDGSARALLELTASALPVSFATAWVVTRYVENPARAWMRRRAAPAAEAAGATDAVSALEPAGSPSPALAPPG